MKAVLQRVSRASVTVDGRELGAIGQGILILLGVQEGDTDTELDALVAKISGLRIFNDAEGRMNHACEDIGGSYLVVSQFTLCADTRRGKRPGFENAMKPPAAKNMYEQFCDRLAVATSRPVARGEFGAEMLVELLNEGPATFILEFPPTLHQCP